MTGIKVCPEEPPQRFLASQIETRPINKYEIRNTQIVFEKLTERTSLSNIEESTGKASPKDKNIDIIP